MYDNPPSEILSALCTDFTPNPMGTEIALASDYPVRCLTP